MNSSGPIAEGSDAAVATAEPSGLTAEHRVALNEASAMIANGDSVDAAVDHLVAHDMPRVVAKVLVKQYDRTRK